jgi:dTDP-glucose pyrophosphorylase
MLKRNISNFTILDDKNINQAIIKLNKANPPILFVVDQNKNYKGTITDGDIRRYILTKKPLTNNLINITNKKSIICKIIDLEKKLNFFKNIIVQRNLKGIPVIKSKKICGVIFSSQKIEINTPIVIMAGGKGERLLPYTKNIPKSLIQINNKPIIQYIIEKIVNENFVNVFVSVNHYAPQIKEYFKINKNFGLNINFIEEKKPMGTAGSLSLINIKNIKNIKNIIIINSDIMTNLKFNKVLNYHEENKYDITMGCMIHKYHMPFGIVNLKNKKFNNVTEKPILSNLVSAGINILSSKLIKEIKKNNHLSMIDFINSQSKKKKIGIFPMHEEWVDIGNKENLIIARQKFRKI